MIRRLVASLIALGLCTAGGAVAAQSLDDEVRAAAAFDRALERKRAGDIEGACVAFAESERIQSALGTRLNLAECMLGRGELLAAAATLRAIAADARVAGDARREERARAELARLEPRIPTLAIRPPPAAVVMLDGVPIATDAPVAIDPGPHLLTIRRDGDPAEERHLVVVEGQREVIDLRPVAVATAPAPPPSVPPAVGRGTRRARSQLGLGLGLGAASLAAGSVALYVVAWGNQAEADRLCPRDLAGACPRGTSAQATRFNGAAVWQSRTAFGLAVGAGAFAAAAGYVWWRGQRAPVEIALAPGGVQLAYRGSLP